MGATLDLDQMARGLINIVVPHFSNSASLLLLESLVAADEPPAPQGDGSYLLRRMAIATDDSNPEWDAAFPTGEVLRYPAESPYAECMRTGRPVREPAMTTDEAVELAESWLRRPMANLLSGSSMLLLPLNARGSTLGFIVCNRRKGFRSFDAYDTRRRSRSGTATCRAASSSRSAGTGTSRSPCPAPAWRWWSGTWRATASGPRSLWGGCAPRSRH
jgi:hypothetical protein